ncbi:MAG: VOC family protein [Chloroflexi bacterium]|nr:VOC family protein [Chloroflexota bacterium]
MSLRQGEAVIDGADHEAVVPFWVAALGWERRDVNEPYVAVVSPAAVPAADDDLRPLPPAAVPAADDDLRPLPPAAVPAADDDLRPLPLLFQVVPEPRLAKNRVHIERRSDDRQAEVSRLVGLGASGARHEAWAR